jgi:hypothetical protein
MRWSVRRVVPVDRGESQGDVERMADDLRAEPVEKFFPGSLPVGAAVK